MKGLLISVLIQQDYLISSNSNFERPSGDLEKSIGIRVPFLIRTSLITNC